MPSNAFSGHQSPGHVEASHMGAGLIGPCQPFTSLKKESKEKAGGCGLGRKEIWDLLCDLKPVTSVFTCELGITHVNPGHKVFGVKDALTLEVSGAWYEGGAIPSGASIMPITINDVLPTRRIEADGITAFFEALLNDGQGDLMDSGKMHINQHLDLLEVQRWM